MGRLDKDKLPQYCPMRTMGELVNSSVKRYKFGKAKEIYLPATITEKEAFEQIRGVRTAVRPRVREVVELGKLLGVRKMGVAFCSGLKDEALRVVEVFEKHGFQVISAVCKCGGVDKTKLGVPEEYKIRGPSKFEAACNPILQAALLNKAETEVNVLIGLCVGHDMIFTLGSRVPVTTLIVKDRVTGHNPAMSLYSSYLRRVVEKAQPR